MISSKVQDYKSVLIAGRPNVGKSTLFNKLLGINRSITDEIYGVTRDLIKEVCVVDSYKFYLIDAGGFTLLKDEISKLVVNKVIGLLDSIDLILLVLDVNEMLSEDYELIEKLRKYSDKIVLVLNKIDSQHKKVLAYEFQKLGFQRSFLISATHGKGIDSLRSFLKNSVGNLVSDDNTIDVKIGIIGKPNSGKSTLINFLAGHEVSIVSPIAGTTRDFIKSKFQRNGKTFELIDTAGIRRRARVNAVVEHYSVSRALRVIDMVDIIFLLIDVKEDLTTQDKKIAHYATKKGKGIIIVFTKWDLLETKRGYFEALKNRVKFFFPVLSFSPILRISVHNKMGIDNLFKEAIKLKKQLEFKTSTADLNKMLSLWIKDYHLSASHKVKYITQVSVNPVKFILFTNKITNFPNSYYNYLVNNIRKIGYYNIPILVELR
ncbi:ribosome biogenesis GTPase Der [Borrelia miyamotoi]|uniref:GTPase Der n=1 Tax=Borrelia miyamotoi TaxID=47466 RepID=A0AAQ2WUY0_9SPIR|nr:ribosome biogenesis GTPase Der [Borrelia miyamotoi]AGT27468.1 GTP-binding protein Der [Borrelia miyamotoi LB-2001]AJA58653.1 GTP-binding protein Der [Borrelia miyamotoi]AOW95735.1 ribosome biogenesis GTPase Der [Borrelia miyamotoi]QTL83618.1 ribosome biogenesis GTPase Der [Borrelia miyamotoi]WAZ85081.1 ribosome biogenesis GTPase Der [Borrelia miyamotoi]